MVDEKTKHAYGTVDRRHRRACLGRAEIVAQPSAEIRGLADLAGGAGASQGVHRLEQTEEPGALGGERPSADPGLEEWAFVYCYEHGYL